MPRYGARRAAPRRCPAAPVTHQLLLYVCMCVYYYFRAWTDNVFGHGVRDPQSEIVRIESTQDSSKGGAVETGCSYLYGVMYYFTISYYPNPLHPPLTAPPFDEHPVTVLAGHSKFWRDYGITFEQQETHINTGKVTRSRHSKDGQIDSSLLILNGRRRAKT